MLQQNLANQPQAMTIFAGLRLQGCPRRSNGKVRNGLEYEVVGFDSEKVPVKLARGLRTST